MSNQTTVKNKGEIHPKTELRFFHDPEQQHWFEELKVGNINSDLGCIFT